MRFWFLLIGIFFVSAGQVGAEETYRIAVAGNTLSSLSKAAFNTVELIADEYNNTVNPVKLEAVFIDENEENVKDAINNQGNLLGVIGCFGDEHKDAFENIKDAPMISICSQCSRFTAADGDNKFRITASDIELARIQARIDYAVFGHRKFACIYEEDNEEYLKIGEAYVETIKANNGQIPYFRSIKPERDDFKPILIRLRELKVKVIFFVGSMENAAEMAKQSRKLNVGAVFSSTNVIFDRRFIKKARTGSEGAEFVTRTPPSLYRYVKKLRPFMSRYRKRYKTVNNYIPYVYEAAVILVDALEKGKTGKHDVKDYLKETEFEGVLGKIAFDESGERKDPKFYFYVIRGREFLPMSSRTYMNKYMTAK